MTDKEADSLLKKYRAGKCTADELALIESWYMELEGAAPNPGTAVDFDLLQERIWSRVTETSRKQKKVKERRYWSVAAAACVLLAAGTGYLMFSSRERPQTKIVQTTVQDIPAGTNKAVLILAGGQQIILDTARMGPIATQGGVTVTKNKNGQLVYTISNLSLLPKGERGTAYNTISTPNGGQYELILPDGSHVFLNAASSLKYPIAFNGPSRRVELSGEGYFEVAKNRDKPFIVSSKGQSVKVLGTHFNVASYPDEPVITTLVEGKVEISASSFPQKAILRPGDQSTVLTNGLVITKVNAQDIVAWKDGLFVFSETNLRDVMRQIARWYDVEVDYASMPNIKFDGEISRETTLLNVLKLIEAGSETQFKLEGRRIMHK